MGNGPSILTLVMAFLAVPVLCHAQPQLESAEPSFSFRTSVLPILTKAGCNAGACHGAAPGAGGFKLSLLGYDPDEDYERITREFGGRRIDLDLPAQSLLLQKPTGQMEHEGGRKLPRGSPEYRSVLQWIEQGAPFGRRDLTVQSIFVAPGDVLFSSTETNVAIQVTAQLSDGSRKNVTSLALFDSNDDGIAAVNKQGWVTMSGHGATSIMVRYGGQVAAVRVALPYNIAVKVGGFHTSTNIVDTAIASEWQRLGLAPAADSGDSEFLRRVYLDLTGQLPPVAAARSVAEKGHLDRTERIGELLRSEPFLNLWTMHLADLLQIGARKGDAAAAKVYYHWVRSRIETNAPLDHIVSEIITANGTVTESGPANFYTLAADPRDTAENVSRIFMGTQLACARCHAHPTDRWTQDDYYGFAAFFAGVLPEGGEIKLKQGREVLHPKTSLPVKPKPLGSTYFPGVEEDPRQNLAQWITSAENPFFAKSIVNRVWKKLMGHGLVEPVDDLRPTNPATHPLLLDALAAKFVSDRYDLRKLIETIVSSRAYQLSSTPSNPKQKDVPFYSHAYVKPLPAAVLLDAINDVTGEFEHFQNYPAGTRSVQLVGSMDESYALDVLGRCQREKPCDPGTAGGGGLAQALHLLNGATVHAKLKGGRVRSLAQGSRSVRAIVNEVYLATLSRLPTGEEHEYWSDFFTKSATQDEAVEDICWVLLNSREFTFNH